MLKLQTILNENLQVPNSCTLVLTQNSSQCRLLFHSVADNIQEHCVFSGISNTIKSSRNNSVVRFHSASEDTDIMQIAGINFSSVVLVEYQGFGDYIKSVVKSRLRSMDCKLNVYGSNSKEFHGYVELNWF